MTRDEIISRLDELIPGLVDYRAASDRELAQVLDDLVREKGDRFVDFEPIVVERAR